MALAYFERTNVQFYRGLQTFTVMEKKKAIYSETKTLTTRIQYIFLFFKLKLKFLTAAYRYLLFRKSGKVATIHLVNLETKKLARCDSCVDASV